MCVNMCVNREPVQKVSESRVTRLPAPRSPVPAPDRTARARPVPACAAHSEVSAFAGSLWDWVAKHKPLKSEGRGVRGYERYRPGAGPFRRVYVLYRFS